MNSLKMNKSVCFETSESKLYSRNQSKHTKAHLHERVWTVSNWKSRGKVEFVTCVLIFEQASSLGSSYLVNTECVTACCQLMDSFKRLFLNDYFLGMF